MLHRVSVSRPPDSELEVHEEVPEEESENSAGKVLRHRLQGFISRISTRISSMSGASGLQSTSDGGAGKPLSLQQVLLCMLQERLSACLAWLWRWRHPTYQWWRFIRCRCESWS